MTFYKFEINKALKGSSSFLIKIDGCKRGENEEDSLIRVKHLFLKDLTLSDMGGAETAHSFLNWNRLLSV